MATPKRFLVYQITNLINNMIYVGAHVTRKIDDTYMGSGKRIRQARSKEAIAKTIETFERKREEKERLKALSEQNPENQNKQEEQVNQTS